MAAATTILGAFNNHLLEFLDDVERVFPDDKDIKKSRMTLEMMKKVKPQAIIALWHQFVSKPYADKIHSGDISFFVEKDYTTDLATLPESSTILSIINRLRDNVRRLDEENLEKSMKYIQNLTKMSEIYMSSH